MPTTCCFCGDGLEISADTKLSFQAECQKCSRDLHCCKMCDFYDSTVYNECRESSAERIVDKEKKNFCDYFQLTQSGHKSQAPAQSALAAAEALFKK